MGSLRNWMLGAAVMVGAAGVGATTAQAAEFGFHVRGPVAYVPPCPGPGYVWVNGYYNGGVFVNGYWNAPVVRFGGPAIYRGGYHEVDRGYRFDGRVDRHFDRGGFRR